MASARNPLVRHRFPASEAHSWFANRPRLDITLPNPACAEVAGSAQPGATVVKVIEYGMGGLKR